MSKTLIGAPDRVSYSLAAKVNMGNYENVDFHFSYSSDVKETETKDEALKRVVTFVESKFEEKHDEIESMIKPEK